MRLVLRQFNQTTLDGLTSFPPDIHPLRKTHVLSQKLQRAIQSTAEGGEVFASIAAATALANQDSLGNIRFIAPHLGQGVNADGMLVQKIDTAPLSPATHFTQDGIARQQYSLNNSLTQHSAIHGANDTTMIHAYNLYCSHAGYQVVPIASAARFYGWLVRHNTILASVLVSIISKDKDLLSQFEWTFVYPNRGSPWCGIQIAAAILIAGNMFERIGATPHELQNIRVSLNRLHDSIPKHIECLSESNLHVTSSHLLRIIQRACTLLGQLECFMTPSTPPHDRRTGPPTGKKKDARRSGDQACGKPTPERDVLLGAGTSRGGKLCGRPEGAGSGAEGAAGGGAPSWPWYSMR